MSRVAQAGILKVRTEATSSSSPLCALCEKAGAAFRFEKNGFKIFQCPKCGFQFVHPPPEDDALRDFYQNEKYFQGDGDFGYSDYGAQREFYRNLFRSHLARLGKHGPAGRLLDIGCGKGDFLVVAREAGWEAVGVEISDAARVEAAHQSGCAVFRSLKELVGMKESFDVLTLWEFIEHLPRPNQMMTEALAYLKPRGMVALTTPNTRNLTAERSPSAWTEFKPPEHLQFFDFRTVRDFLVRRHALEVIDLRGIHPDLRLASSPWVESVLAWATRLRQRHNARSDPRWWIYAGLARILKDLPRRSLLLAHWIEPELLQTGIFALARKRGA